jgi:hypothetical protein
MIPADRLILWCLLVLPALARIATLLNIALPRDQHGEQFINGEASAMIHNGSYYFYFNNWGTCPGNPFNALTTPSCQPPSVLQV